MTADAVAFLKPILPEKSGDRAISEPLPPMAPGSAGLADLWDVRYDWNRSCTPTSLRDFEARWSNRRSPVDLSGVWRFRELLPFAPEDRILTIGEGQTQLRESTGCAQFAGVRTLLFQYEGLNPSGSFKDNGMTAATTHAAMLGATSAACASTGNTSASLAVFAGATGAFRAVVFVGGGTIAKGKLSQALDFGSRTLQIEGDFDDALVRVREVCEERNIYLCNSVNPFRIEGQKTTIYRILEGLDWQVPDWIVVPGGNLGNSSAFGKALYELKELGLIERLPRMAVINADGANPLFELFDRGIRWAGGQPDLPAISAYFEQMDAENRRARTVASAIQINRPVNLLKCLRALEWCDGVVRQVTDEDILNAKAMIGRHGFGCEPASAASLAGVKQLREDGTIASTDRVVCVLTGHQLKDATATVDYHSRRDPYSNQPVQVRNELQPILEALE